MADPTGLLRENTILKDQISALSKKLLAGDILSKIPGELLAPTHNELSQVQPDGPDTQRVMIRLPDGARAEVTFVKLKSKKGKTTRWFWTPHSAALIEDE
jgi:hypothetical protein